MSSKEKGLETFADGIDEVLAEIRATLISKQMDYGKSNILDFGEIGILVRTNDKIARLKNLIMNNKKAKNESVDDSWKDLAGYAVLALMLRRGTFNLPMEEEEADG